MSVKSGDLFEVDGQPIFKVEVEVTQRKFVYVAADSKGEAVDAALELYQDSKYVTDDDSGWTDDGYARQVYRDATPEGTFVWVGGEDGDWRRWNGRELVVI